MRNRLVLPLPFGPATRSASPPRSASESERKSFRPPRSHSRSRPSSTPVLLQSRSRSGFERDLAAQLAVALLQVCAEQRVGARRQRVAHRLPVLGTEVLRGTPQNVLFF